LSNHEKKVDGRCFERTKDWPAAGQWAQTGFKDSDSIIPRGSELDPY